MRGVIAVLVLCSLAIACASTPARVDISKASVGMTKAEVRARLGDPVNVVGAKQYPDGVMEILQYGYDTNQMFDGRPGPPGQAYFLYFFNDNLLQWGRAGDWQREADVVYEVRVR